MNRTEHLLTCLAEECGEVAKEIHKALRFGLDDKLTRDPSGPRGTDGPTNREKIIEEFIDLIGVYRLLVHEGVLPDIGLHVIKRELLDKLEMKGIKVCRFMGYAARVGALTTENGGPR